MSILNAAHFGLATCLLLCTSVWLATAEQDPPPVHIEWYISSSNGSDDATTCGRSADAPCSSLQPVIADSESFTREGTTCFLAANGSADGRASTTVYFMEGEHFVPAVCLSNWENLTVSGLGGGARIVSRLGAARGFFEFEDCRNLEIRDLEFGTAFVGKATLYFRGSSGVVLSGLTVNAMADHSFGIVMEENFGSISLTDVTIFGNPDATGYQNNVLGLQITQGCVDASSLGSGSCLARSIDLTISNCTVRDLASGGDAVDSYSTSHRDAIGMVLRFLFNATGNRITVQDSTFTRIHTSRASGVLVNFNSQTSDNVVQFLRCDFQDNVVRYGGGIAAYFYSSPSNSELIVESCDFTNNTATLEGGGVFLASLSRDVSSTVQISDSSFTENRAIFGAAVYFFNNPTWFSPIRTLDAESVLLPLVSANISDCTFARNNGSVEKGVLHALRMQLGVLGTNSFLLSKGSALVLHSSLAHFEGNVSFVGNVAVRGGAIRIVDGSRVDMSEVTFANFTGNKAIFTGGAIFADDASTTLLAGEFNHSVAQARFRSCFLTFGEELRQMPVQDRVIFRGNQALSEGDTIYAFSLRGCVVGNFVPFNTSRFLTIENSGAVSYDEVSTLESTATGASFLFFYGASSRCYKPVGDTTFLLPNCSHELLNETFSLQSDLQCGLRSMLQELNRIYTIGTGLRPPLDKLLLPWVGIEADWNIEPGSDREDCPQSIPGELYLAPAPGEQFDLTVQLADQFLNVISDTIYLEVEHEVDTPSGVVLQLNGIQYAFNDRVFFTPNRALSGLALVGLPGTEGRLRVVAASQIRGDSIALLLPFQLAQCPPGYYHPPATNSIDEVNELLLSNYSVTQRLPPDQPLACQCFSSPGSAVTFSSRVTDVAHTCVAGHTIQLNSLLWAGYQATTTQPPSSNSNNGDVEDSFQPNEIPCPEVPVNATPIEDDLSVFVSLSRQRTSAQGSIAAASSINFSPVDVVPYEGGVTPGGGAPVVCYGNNSVTELVRYQTQGQFLIEFCTRGYCLGDSRSGWNVGDVGFPCVANRHGTLCGQCLPGFAVTLYTSECQDCSSGGRGYQPYLALFLTLLLGLALVVVVVLLNLGVSPSLDSLLFFIQAVMIILSGRAAYQNFQYLAIFNPNFTFNLCIVSNLNGLIRLLLQYVTPIYILLLLCTVLLLTYIKGLSKYLGRHNFLQALWLLFLISYLNIANTTFEIIHCRVIGPQEGGERTPVLVHDASIECFKGAHLPIAIIAIAIGILFVVPFPLYSIIFMFIPKLKPITDVYTSHYKRYFRYWVFWSLLRRLLLVALSVIIQDYFIRHVYLLLATILILSVFIFTWPYKTKVENNFGVFICISLLLVTFVTTPELDRTTDPDQIVSSLITTVTIVVGILLVVVETIFRHRSTTVGREWKSRIVPWFKKRKAALSQCWQRRTGKNRELEERELEVSTIVLPANTVDATAFREPLLDSVFTGSTAQTSLNSSSIEHARRKAKTTLAKHKSATSSPVKMENGEMMDSQGRSIGVTVVGPPDHTDTRLSDSGFATARTYTDQEQFTECYRNMDPYDGGGGLATSVTSTIDATAFREPVLDSILMNSSTATNTNSEQLEQSREKARETLNRHKARTPATPQVEEAKL